LVLRILDDRFCTDDDAAAYSDAAHAAHRTALRPAMWYQHGHLVGALTRCQWVPGTANRTE